MLDVHRTNSIASRSRSAFKHGGTTLLACSRDRRSWLYRIRKPKKVSAMSRYRSIRFFCYSIENRTAGIMRLSTYVLVIVFPINIALNALLAYHTSLGVMASPIAVSITYWLSFFILILFTYFSKTHRENGTWANIRSRDILDVRGIWMFLKLAIPGILMVGTEWYEVA